MYISSLPREGLLLVTAASLLLLCRDTSREDKVWDNRPPLSGPTVGHIRCISQIQLEEWISGRLGLQDKSGKVR